jgi:hypothetical protein
MNTRGISFHGRDDLRAVPLFSLLGEVVSSKRPTLTVRSEIGPYRQRPILIATEDTLISWTGH